MYFHARLFFRAIRLALFKPPFSLRRWCYVGFFVALFWLMWGVVALGRALDHLLFPGFKRQQVREPLFIVAPPRSGTTFTQKLLALDTGRFVHSKLYQTILPSVTWQKLVHGLIALDRLLGRPLERCVGWVERRWFGSWDELHKLRLNEPEEDDGYFVYTFVTEAIFLLFPFIDELWEAGFVDNLPANDQQKLMRYYKSCLQRHLYVNGPDKMLLSKSTQFPGSLHALHQAFPDARFVTIIRHPYESVPSHVSLFYMAWQTHSLHLGKQSTASRAYARLSLAWYRHLFEVKDRLPSERFYSFDFRQLTAAPAPVLLAMYAHFGFKADPAFQKAILVASQQPPSRQPHHYSLEEFGLSREWIQRYVGDIMDAYGLERGERKVVEVPAIETLPNVPNLAG